MIEYFKMHQITTKTNSPSQHISFESDHICLDIPREGLDIEGGWKLDLKTRPKVRELSSILDNNCDGVNFTDPPM